MKRGRPETNTIVPNKRTLDTKDSTWYYDKQKSKNGPYLVQLKFEPGFKTKPDIDQRMYGKSPVVMVFKTSNRSNAKTKIKVFRKNIDYVLKAKKLPGVPEKAEIVELAVGKSFIDKYKQKYDLV